jgi:hypothetical protein
MKPLRTKGIKHYRNLARTLISLSVDDRAVAGLAQPEATTLWSCNDPLLQRRRPR